MIAKVIGRTKTCHGESPTGFNAGAGWVVVCLKCSLKIGPFDYIVEARRAWNKLPEKIMEEPPQAS